MNDYIITDIVGYAHDMRELCVTNITNSKQESTIDEQDSFITINEIISIIIEKCKKKNKNNQIIINEQIHKEIYSNISDWVYGIGLANLAANNQIECAWDNDENTMVFWNPKEKTKDENRTIKRTKRKN